MVNESRVRDVVDQIVLHPESWDQRYFSFKDDCGTSFCFAGWACLLAGQEFVYSPSGEGELRSWRSSVEVACEYLGLSRDVAEQLFFYTSVDEFHEDGMYVGHRHPTLSEFLDRLTMATGIAFDYEAALEAVAV